MTKETAIKTLQDWAKDIMKKDSRSWWECQILEAIEILTEKI